MAINAKYVVLIALLLAISDITEARKSLSSGRNRGGSSSSGSSGRRQQTSSSGHVTKPTYQHSQSQSQSNSHAEQAKLSYGSSYNSAPNPKPAGPGQIGSSNTNYQQGNAGQIPKQTATQQNGAPIGWNVPKQESPSVAVNKPPSYSQANQGPPPAYSPHNVPGGAHSNINDRPPMYSPPGSNAAYPIHQGPPPGYQSHQGPPGYQSHQGPQPSSGINQHPPPGYPIHQGPPPSYQQSAAGGIGQPSIVHHHYNGGAPQPQPGGYVPVAGVQPGFYPAGSFPQQSSSSGLGFGTGLIAGGLGGALLGHALTPSRSGGSSSNNDNDHDRVIIINNTPGAAGTVAGAPGVPAPAVAPGAPLAPGSTYTAPETPVPLAPFPSQQNAPAGAPPMQPMSDPAAMTPMQNNPVNPMNPAAATGSVGSDTVPLAPMQPNNSSEPPPPGDQVQYGIMCVPIYVNATDPLNPENVTLVEQMYCYNATIPAAESTTSPLATSAQPNMMPEQPNLQSPMMTLQNQPQPEVHNTQIPTQKPSSASLADTTIVKSGTVGIHQAISTFGLLISTIFASYLIN